MRTKGIISAFVRRFGLLELVDLIRYRWIKFIDPDENERWKKANPNVSLPPDYLVYESFQLNWEKYFIESVDSAQFISSLIREHSPDTAHTILDWGCGPARVIRHMGKFFPNAQLFGSDYNQDSINWCTNEFPDISFNLNGIEARLPYDDCQIDVVYAISVFTHLSEQSHSDWMSELWRILKTNGLFIFSTQGENFRVKLLSEERTRFDNGELVTRGNVKEGHRTYSSFQPKSYIERLSTDNSFKVENHIVRPTETGRSLPQDFWIIRKIIR